MIWWWGDWFPHTDESFDDRLISTCTIVGVCMMLVPIVVVYLYTAYEGITVYNYITASWQEISNR